MASLYRHRINTNNHGRRKGIIGEAAIASAGGFRVTKQSLVPPNNTYHKDIGLNEFISNKFDHYAREYGEFF